MDNGGLRQALFGNLALKLLSLAIAVVLYLAVVKQPVAEVGLLVPVQYRNVPPHYEITSEQMAQVHVRLKGPADLVSRATQSDVVAYIDLRGAEPGMHSYDLLREGAIHAPYGLQIADVWPAQLDVELERNESRQLGITPRIVGRPALGYTVTGYKLDPEQLRVVGPQSQLQSLRTAVTDTIDVSGLTTTTSAVTHVRVPDVQVHVLGPGTTAVTVFIAPKAR